MPDAACDWLRWYDEHCDGSSMAPTHIRRLLEENERLRGVVEEAERISAEAHLAADIYAYDLMRTVLRPLEGAD